MKYLIGLDEVDPVDRRYIGLETRLQGKQAIDQRRTVYQEWIKKWPSRLLEDEIAEFLTKTERKETKNKQNILLDGCCLRFEGYLQDRKTCFSILKLCPNIGLSLEGS